MSNILKLDTKLRPEEFKRIESVKNEKAGCQHFSVIIDEKEKVIRCKCGQVLTSWEYILKISSKTDHTLDWIVDLGKRKHALEMELADLKRQVRNAKSQLSRIDKKLTNHGVKK